MSAAQKMQKQGQRDLASLYFQQRVFLNGLDK